jgi:ankyrin repeat protein
VLPLNEALGAIESKIDGKFITEDQTTNMIDFLINNGADVHVEDGDGYSFLDLALTSNNEKIINYLLDKGIISEEQLPVRKALAVQKLKGNEDFEQFLF